MSWFGLAVRRSAGKQKDLGSIRFGSPLSSKVAAYGHCIVTLPLTMNETLKWLSSLLRSHSGGDSVALGISSSQSVILVVTA